MLRRKKAVIRTYPAPIIEFEDNHLGAVYSVADVDSEIARLEKKVETLTNERDGFKGLLAHEREGKEVVRRGFVAAEARVKELEGKEAQWIETGGQCFRVARQIQRAAGDNNDTSTWLEGRLKRLSELEAEREDAVLVPAYWKDRAREAEAKLAALAAEDELADHVKEWDMERRVLIGRVNALEDSRAALKKNLATAERQIRDLMKRPEDERTR